MSSGATTDEDPISWTERFWQIVARLSVAVMCLALVTLPLGFWGGSLRDVVDQHVMGRALLTVGITQLLTFAVVASAFIVPMPRLGRIILIAAVFPFAWGFTGAITGLLAQPMIDAHLFPGGHWVIAYLVCLFAALFVIYWRGKAKT